MRKLHWFFKCLFVVSLLFLIWTVVSTVLPSVLPTRIVSGEIRGLIFQNQIWDKQVVVSGDLVTLSNVRVTIEPGTKVYISKSGDRNNFDLLPWHLNHGINTGPEIRGVLTGEPFWDEKEKVFVYLSHLKASGKEQPIIITSSGEEKSPYDINLIKIGEGEVSNVFFSNYRRLEIGPNVKVVGSRFENTGECALCIFSGSPLIERNIFKKGRRDYINVNDATPLILNNEFLESEGDGLLIQSSHDNFVRISNNVFQMPSKKAIKVNSTSQRGDISGNLFYRGDIEFPCSSKIRLIRNLIRVNLVFKNIGGCDGEYTIFENYWEIIETQSILNARISKPSDQFQVKIPNVLKSPPKVK